MATWPINLPQRIARDGFREVPKSQVIRSETDSGAPKQRRRFSATITTFSVVINLTDTEVTTFETFFETQLLGGSMSFDWVHPRTQNPAVVRIVGGAYTLVNLGGTLYQVSFSMEVLP